MFSLRLRVIYSAARMPARLARPFIRSRSRDEEADRRVDGYATVWFDDQAAFQAGFGGDYARTEVLPNNANFNRMDEILTLDVTEHVIR